MPGLQLGPVKAVASFPEVFLFAQGLDSPGPLPVVIISAGGLPERGPSFTTLGFQIKSFSSNTQYLASNKNLNT